MMFDIVVGMYWNVKNLGENQTEKRKNFLKRLKYEGMEGVVEMQRTLRMVFLLNREGNVTPHF